MKYRKEIDGLRAVAVLPVILFHAGFTGFSGGFVGVDIFFVISGFLITTILIDELERGDFSIARFYERRARRILPALFFVLFACLPFAWLWMLPSGLKVFSDTLAAVVLFVSNISLQRQSGYFDTSAEFNPLLHTWSLAVEEQYYVVFPLLLMVLWKFGRQRVVWVLAGLAALSLLVSEYGVRQFPADNFFFSPSRAWELLAGSLCACVSAGRQPRSNGWLSGLGIFLILYAIVFFNHNVPFPGLYTLVPVVGTALVLLFAAQTPVARVLSAAPLVWVGLISYSAYLWHQPLFAFARLRSLETPPQWLMLALCAASLALAFVTWKYVEQPFRKTAGSAALLTRPTHLALASSAGGIILLGAALLGQFSDGMPQRFSDEAIRSLDARMIPNHGLHADCDSAFNASPNCYTSTSPTMLLWGDSYAMHLAPGILAGDPGVKLQQHTMPACSPLLGLSQLPPSKRSTWAKRCISFNDKVLEWLRRTPSVRTVVLSSPFAGVLEQPLYTRDGRVSGANAMDVVRQALLATADEIRKSGARVIIVSPPPASGWDIGHCLEQSIFQGLDPDRSCSFALNEGDEAASLLRSVSAQIPVYWLRGGICEGATCQGAQDGVLLYRDNGHLTREGSASLGKAAGWAALFAAMAR